MRALFLFTATVIFIGSAYAQADLEKDVATCAIVPGSLDRLQCFDDVAKTHQLVPTSQPPGSSNGNWNVDITTNPIDDSKTVVLSTIAEGATSRFGDRITLIARCKSNETEVYINWNDYLGDDSSSVYRDFKYVTTRFGDQEATRDEWNVSTDSRATFAPGWGGSWIQRLSQVDEFVAQTTPYNENPRTAVFDVSGLRQAAAPLAEACNWDFD